MRCRFSSPLLLETHTYSHRKKKPPQAFAKLLELGVDRGEDGFAHLVAKAKKEGVSPDQLAPTRKFQTGCPMKKATL